VIGKRRLLTNALWAVLFGGGLFATAATAQTYHILKTFSSAAAHLPESLFQGTDGYLYGTTAFGGANSSGTIFKIDTNGSTLTTLHNFAGSDGRYPAAGLIQGTDGYLYGTTSQGGASNYGTVFKISSNGSTFTTLHSFTAGSDGAGPEAGLIQGTDGYLYGTTINGGPSGEGTIFKIGTGGGAYATLHSFAGSDGANPYTGLIQATDGHLYGTTAQGGAPPGLYGTIFRIGINGGAFAVLHSFAAGSDGASPYAALIQGTDGYLYGTTANGGASGYGTIFKISTGGTHTTLHNLVSSDGTHPYANLIQRADGLFYGTTSSGGASGYGTIFKIDTNGSTLTPLHSLDNNDGANPLTGLIQGLDGNLYGTASAGGAAGGGVLFRIALGGCFDDVPPADPLSTFICTVARDGVAAGCGEGNYCPDNPVTRAQMAVFLLKAEHGSSYAPPMCLGIFADVPCPGGFAVDWIEQLASEGITAGCGGSNYCPGDPVTRAQMAVLLLKAEHGSGYAPPACVGVFQDVACTPNPAFAVDWIERLYAEGVTGGCSASPLLYCPDSPNTRGQMAVFLVKTFNLP
jgi:uncharacterized repeat protein (TIGR03803 family)